MPLVPCGSSGNVSFHVLNRRVDYVFVYVTGGAQYQTVTAISNKITFKDTYLPTQPRVSAVPGTPDAVCPHDATLPTPRADTQPYTCERHSESIRHITVLSIPAGVQFHRLYRVVRKSKSPDTTFAQMAVHWTAKGKTKPVLKFGTESGKYTTTLDAVGFTYEKEVCTCAVDRCSH